MPRNINQPRGVAVLILLISLGIVAVLLSLLLRQAALARRAYQQDRQTLQAEWLAEAGVERAAARLAADAKYTGETWQVPARDLKGNDGGEVRIKIDAAASGRSTLHVEADYPAATETRSRCTKRIDVDKKLLAARQAQGQPPAKGTK